MNEALDLLDLLEWDSTGKREIARATLAPEWWEPFWEAVDERWPGTRKVGVTPGRLFGIPVLVDQDQTISYRVWDAQGGELHAP